VKYNIRLNGEINSELLGEAYGTYMANVGPLTDSDGDTSEQCNEKETPPR